MEGMGARAGALVIEGGRRPARERKKKAALDEKHLPWPASRWAFVYPALLDSARI